MTHEDVKKKVYEANMELFKKGITLYTWGNVSELIPDEKIMFIKPSGVDYEVMDADDIVGVDINTGLTVEGSLKPSTDTNTHIEIYKSLPSIGGITHTHSTNAVAFSQSGLSIPVLGTTHADYFYGKIMCTRGMTDNEIENDYEKNTGKVIVETIETNKIDPLSTPAVLVRNHGPFTFGKTAKESVFNAVVLETVAEMALKTLMLNNESTISPRLIEKHYKRKHGMNAYYGQK